jgi:uncharacterized protein YdaU (DUF1376 family)
MRFSDMSGQPYMPFFFGDFLASTVSWTGEERALYGLLLLCQWSTGPLPDDPIRICRMVQYDRETFLALWPTVRAKFIPAEGGGLVNLRCELHRAKTAEISRKRAEAGARGGMSTQARNRASGEQTNESSGEQTSSNEQASAQAIARPLLDHPYHSIPIQSKPTEQEQTHRTSVTCEGCDGPECCDAQQSIDLPEPEPSESEFEQLQRAYPRRAGSQRWQDARNAYRARKREGHTADVILAGVIRYAEHVRAKGDEGTSYVMQAATFLGKNLGFLEPWSTAPTRAQQRQDRSVSAAQAWLADNEGTS